MRIYRWRPPNPQRGNYSRKRRTLVDKTKGPLRIAIGTRGGNDTTLRRTFVSETNYNFNLKLFITINYGSYKI
jgi:hypothetical protein